MKQFVWQKWRHALQGANKMDPLTDKFNPIFDQSLKQFLNFMREQVKSKLFCVRWEYTVTVKMIKNAVKMV